jgi:hypothetical protein
MTTKQIITVQNAVTDVTTEIGFPTNQTDKTFQLVVEVDDTLSPSAQAAALAASLSVTVKIQVSNDRKNWHDLYAAKTLVKGAAAASISDYWDPASTPAQHWGHHRALITAIAAGAKASVWMALPAY